MSWLEKIDPVQVQAWVGVLLAVLAVVKWYRDNRQRDKIDLARALVPKVHDVVERIAQNTPTEKDDLFVQKLGELLRMAGFDLEPGDPAALRSLGTAEHEARKAEIAPLPAPAERCNGCEH